MLTNGIMLTSNGSDTLRPLGIQLRPFANSVHDTKYHIKQCDGMKEPTYGYQHWNTIQILMFGGYLKARESL